MPWTRPSIAWWAGLASSAGSLSSEMSGTVGRERPAVMGACVRGVFWGVGAVRSFWEMGTVEDILGRAAIAARAWSVSVSVNAGQGLYPHTYPGGVSAVSGDNPLVRDRVTSARSSHKPSVKSRPRAPPHHRAAPE